MSQEQPKMPEGTYAITREDKVKIQAFGRKLHAFVIQEVKENPDFNVKTMYGGIDYLNEIITQKRKLVNEDLGIVFAAIEEKGLVSKLKEPFDPKENDVETPDTKILDAAVAPSAGPDIAVEEKPAEEGILSPLQPNIEGIGEKGEDSDDEGGSAVPA